MENFFGILFGIFFLFIASAVLSDQKTRQRNAEFYENWWEERVKEQSTKRMSRRKKYGKHIRKTRSQRYEY